MAGEIKAHGGIVSGFSKDLSFAAKTVALTIFIRFIFVSKRQHVDTEDRRVDWYFKCTGDVFPRLSRIEQLVIIYGWISIVLFEEFV